MDQRYLAIIAMLFTFIPVVMGFVYFEFYADTMLKKIGSEFIVAAIVFFCIYNIENLYVKLGWLEASQKSF